MGRRVDGLTRDSLEQLPEVCRSCVRWELDPMAARRSMERGEAADEKRAWVSEVLLEWGSCGRVLVVDGEPVGHALYAPQQHLPGAVRFPTAPASPDAVLLTGLYVAPEYRAGGLGRVLVQSVAKDLTRRGVRAIEAYGETRSGPSCTPPLGFLLAVGFTTARPHPRHPRLRLDLRTALSWRDDVEEVLGRLLGSVPRRHRPFPAGAPRALRRP